MSTHDAAVAYLRGHQDAIEAALVRGLNRVAECDRAVSMWNRRKALEEQFNLRGGRDCCYDRPGTGFAYASWYHPRRVHELVRRFLPMLDQIPDGTTVLDIGAGTGATAWAIGLSMIALAEEGAPSPSALKVVAIDASPSMLAAGELLWEELIAWQPALNERVRVESAARPWIDPPADVTGGWIVAGHIFDASDPLEEVEEQFKRLLLRAQPSRVLIDAPKVKLLRHEAGLRGAEAAGWTTTPPARKQGRVWVGALHHMGALRRQELAPIPGGALHQNPQWDGGPPVISSDLVRSGPEGTRLFELGPRGLTLDDDQDVAAEPRDRFEVLVGAAGSGKSIVLVERIARTVQAATRAQILPHILVTARNVLMVDQLHRWLCDRLRVDDPNVQSRTRADGDHTLTWTSELGTGSIRLMNWDKVPTQLFHMPATGSADRDAIEARRRRRLREAWHPMKRYPDYLDDLDWLAAEFRRVIHGERIRTLDDYLGSRRHGRLRPLAPQIRVPVWELLMQTEGQTSYTYLWMKLIDRYADVFDANKQVPVEPKFTHAFVDEVQDFTSTDLRFLGAMIGDARNLFGTGDAGQAMLLGQTFDVPGTLRRRRREVTHLTHSYRMTRRVAEAVSPLAASLYERASQVQQRWVGVPAGTRSGVLGVRPVVIVRDGSVHEQLCDVIRTFAPMFPLDVSVTVAEGGRSDRDLVDLLRSLLPAARVASETVARIKGLERTVVVWSTSSRWRLDESAAEFVLTVLTRATSLVVILLDPERTHSGIAAALSQLAEERLMFWTEDAEHVWQSVAHRTTPGEATN